MYQRILVPLDGSSVAEEAIPYALELGRLSGGTLTLVRVIPHSMTAAELWHVRQNQLHEEAELYLAEIAAQPEVAAANPHRVVISGEVGPSLLNLTQQETYDILMMTTRDRRDPVRWILGSVADYLVQRAPIPVLLVRQREA
ncbi:MAG: universal stress protein [Chloroflexi bacterium]|nr:MAG: universal stress protein [Chloroflexota bacterium]MBL1195026.1 universal stress protein [Chloroflexota bacterium]NOH12315.1 universal stress protein [Chloroflexota bacterium]